MKKIIIINLTCVLTAAMFLVILPINIYASDNTTKQALTIENLEISPQSEERGNAHIYSYNFCCVYSFAGSCESQIKQRKSG